MGRVNAEEEPDGSGNKKADEDGPDLYGRWESDDEGDDLRRTHSGYHADDAANQGHRGRLDQELQKDVFSACAEGLADADLAGALGDGYKHDVHDDDAADNE